MTPFMSIKDTCQATGLSQFYLRRGCKDGTIPHIKSGTKFFINVLKFIITKQQKALNPLGFKAFMWSC